MSETEKFAARFAQDLKEGAVLLLEGELGVGKTAFVRGLAQGLGVSAEVMVHSPTFTLVNEYPGDKRLIHVDLYRLNTLSEVEELALMEENKKGAILAIEWPEKGEGLWPETSIRIKIERMSPKTRKIQVG